MGGDSSLLCAYETQRTVPANELKEGAFMGLKVYMNGRFVNKADARISVFDHGVLYGDGVFEGIRSYDGLVFKLREHINRLYRSAGSIELKVPISKAKMIKAVIATLRKNRLTNAYIRLVITRGPGDLGLDPRKCRKGGVIFIITDKIALYPERFYKEGLSIITSKTKRNLPDAINPRIKSLNYLNNILAKIDAIKEKVQEAIMLTHDGYVAECTGDNIFIVSGGRLIAPPPEIGTLEGITRNAVIDIAKKEKIPFTQGKFKLKDIYKSGECFLTGTAAEIVPVVKVDGRVIGSGAPGKLTRELMQKFHRKTKTDGVRY